jgi:hypothetical protein
MDRRGIGAFVTDPDRESPSMPNESDPPNLPARPPRFQFTIRTMLIFTAVVAVLCSVLFTMPEWAAELIFFWLVCIVPAILVTLLIYGDRDQRTFGVGALFPSGFGFLAGLGITSVNLPNLPVWLSVNGRLEIVLFWLFGALNGYLCVLTRRWIEKRREKEKG